MAGTGSEEFAPDGKYETRVTLHLLRQRNGWTSPRDYDDQPAAAETILCRQLGGRLVACNLWGRSREAAMGLVQAVKEMGAIMAQKTVVFTSAGSMGRNVIPFRDWRQMGMRWERSANRMRHHWVWNVPKSGAAPSMSTVPPQYRVLKRVQMMLTSRGHQSAYELCQWVDEPKSLQLMRCTASGEGRPSPAFWGLFSAGAAGIHAPGLDPESRATLLRLGFTQRGEDEWLFPPRPEPTH